MREEIIYLRVNDLRPYKGNPRNNAGAVGAVAESIRKFGFRSPIVIDETNTVINGHTRLKAAKELGLEEVPCVRVTDLSEKQKREYRLVDNKSGELAGWDRELLAAELEACSFEGWDYEFHFEEDLKKAQAWQHTERLCGLEHRPRMRRANDTYYNAIFRTGKAGKPLSEIKTPEYVDMFAGDAALFAEELLGENLKHGGWCVITAPRRRSARDGRIHFATEVARGMAERLGIRFYEDAVTCGNFDRYAPEMRLEIAPAERNVILYDDIITTGLTIGAVRDLLTRVGYVVVMVVSIDNH